MPATFTVDTLDDTADVNHGNGAAQDMWGRTSLRAAIEEANALSGADTIDFEVTGTITLDAGLGQLVIGTNVTIDGPGVTSLLTVTRDTQANKFRIFEITDEANAVIRNLTISNGDAGVNGDGGGILNDGHLTVYNCSITGCFARFGGGIANWGLGAQLEVTDSMLLYNHATISGAGLWVDGTTHASLSSVAVYYNSAGENGGGIANSGTLSIFNNSDIQYNIATNGNGGGIHNFDGDLEMSGGTVASNGATNGNGGGVWTASSSNVTFNGVSISSNWADKGGGVYITQSGFAAFVSCTIQSNTAMTFGDGLVYTTGADYSFGGPGSSCQSIDEDS